MTDPRQTVESPAEALLRARRHARRGAAEWILALRALLDAASLGLGQQPARDHALFAPLSHILDDWSKKMGGSDEDLGALILEALETEIARWEARSRDDEEARSVLRAFLGLREFLWEIGIRSARTTGATPPDESADADDSSTGPVVPEASRVRS